MERPTEPALVTPALVRRALVRAGAGAAIPAGAAFVAAFADAGAAAGATAAAGGVALLGLAVTLLEAAVRQRRIGVRMATLAAAALGAGVGGSLPAQVQGAVALVQGGGPASAALGAYAGLGLLLAATLAWSFAAAAAVVARHRALLDPADVLAGTPGAEQRALLLVVVVSLPALVVGSLLAPGVALLLLLGCRAGALLDRWQRARAGRGSALVARLPTLPRERLELAAYAGDADARALVEAPFAAPGLAGWADGLRVFGQDACLVAGAAAVGAVVPVFERDRPGDPRARAAWRALEALAGQGAAGAARAAVEPLDGPCGEVARAVLAIDGASQPGKATASALLRAAEVVGSAEVVQAAASDALRAWALR